MEDLGYPYFRRSPYHIHVGILMYFRVSLYFITAHRKVISQNDEKMTTGRLAVVSAIGCIHHYPPLVTHECLTNWLYSLQKYPSKMTLSRTMYFWEISSAAYLFLFNFNSYWRLEHAGLLDGLLGVAGNIINIYELDHSLIPYVKRTSKNWTHHHFRRSWKMGTSPMDIISNFPKKNIPQDTMNPHP